MIWPSQRLLDLLGIDLPIIQAPMAGLATSAMAAAVAEAGGLGSMGCAVLSADQIRAELSAIRRQTAKPINLNFFCHASPATDPAREAAWRGQLKSYYVELGLDPEMRLSTLTVDPFGSAHCDLVAELKPEVVSFHFGLPNPDLLARVKGVGAKILSSATCVKEAIWLEQRGCDAIIAQGLEAGGHRGCSPRCGRVMSPSKSPRSPTPSAGPRLSTQGAGCSVLFSTYRPDASISCSDISTDRRSAPCWPGGTSRIRHSSCKADVADRAGASRPSPSRAGRTIPADSGRRNSLPGWGAWTSASRNPFDQRALDAPPAIPPA
jgi:Nitronate monooxygenase